MDWHWPSFKKSEMACKCCQACAMLPSFMEKLQNLRNDFGKPMIISSAYRCSKRNAAVSETGLHGPHTLGQAVDVRVAGKDAYDLLHLALLHGFTGIGVNQKGEFDKRFLHLDTVKEVGLRPRIWSY